ncbi:MAG TPA: ComF family protein [Terriglobales bacterium]|nr:ComF family protein [Terriglobales bacterium]
MLDAFASVLLPAPCRICGATLTNSNRIPICESCFASIAPIQEPMCQICGRPFEFAPQAQTMLNLCRLCRSNFYAFDRARSYALYNETLAGAIMLLKYEEVTRLGGWFAERLADLLHTKGENFRADAIVPVPLHPDRRRERGYNQAELIAKPLARRLGLKLGAYLLMRTKPRPPQLVLSRSEHWKSVRGAYATREGVRVDKLRILLVDDVLTTGATLDACARALKKAGAASVVGLTVARVVPGSSLTASQQLRSKPPGA